MCREQLHLNIPYQWLHSIFIVALSIKFRIEECPTS